jgi:hypothetical protein
VTAVGGQRRILSRKLNKRKEEFRFEHFKAQWSVRDLLIFRLLLKVSKIEFRGNDQRRQLKFMNVKE